MSATIGGIACDFLSGNAADEKEQVRVWHRLGVDGLGTLAIGSGDSEFSFRATRIEIDATVKAWIESIEALQGTTVTIVDDHAWEHANMTIIRVRRLSVAAAYRPGEATPAQKRAVIIVEGIKG